jgi:hypothetical protein
MNNSKLSGDFASKQNPPLTFCVCLNDHQTHLGIWHILPKKNVHSSGFLFVTPLGNQKKKGTFDLLYTGFF